MVPVRSRADEIYNNTSLDGGFGDVNGTPKGREPTPVGQGSGSFSPGIQRAFQFGIRVSF
jgi:hypothetical protein